MPCTQSCGVVVVKVRFGCVSQPVYAGEDEVSLARRNESTRLGFKKII